MTTSPGSTLRDLLVIFKDFLDIQKIEYEKAKIKYKGVNIEFNTAKRKSEKIK